MFNREIYESRSMQFMVVLSIVMGIAAAVTGLIKEFAVEKWLSSRESVSCVVTKNQDPLPFVKHQSVYSAANFEAKVATFIKNYVSLTEDQTYINYGRATDDARYSDSKISEGLRAAIEATDGVERQRIMNLFAESGNTYRWMRENNATKKFMVDSIIVYGSPSMAQLRVKVRGWTWVIYDRAKVDIPINDLGYKEIIYTVIQGYPTEDSDGSPLNKSGLYVIMSDRRNIDPIELDSLERKDTAEYIEDEFKAFKQEDSMEEM